MQKLLILPVLAVMAGITGLGFMSNSFNLNITPFGTGENTIENPIGTEANVSFQFFQNPISLLTVVDRCIVNFDADKENTVYTVKCFLTGLGGGFIQANELAVNSVTNAVVTANIDMPDTNVQDVHDVKVFITEGNAQL